MTIQQHASFDSSAAELNATSKLVKAWESKNAKNAAKAGGISMMALSLAACGGSSTTTTTTDTATTDTTTTVTAVNSAFTTSVDALVGTTAADTFTGDANVTTAADSVDGGAGSDTVKMYGTAALPNMTSIENLEIHDVSPGNVDLTTTALTSVTSLTADTFAAAAQDITIKSGDTVTLVDVSAAASAEINLEAAAAITSQSVTVTNVGTATAAASRAHLDINGSGVATFNITATGAESFVDLLTLTTLTTLNIDGAGDISLTVGGNETTVSAADATGNVTLDGNFAGDVAVTLGAGNDKLIFTGELSAKDVLVGGDGTDTLSITGAGAAGSAASISGFEVLELADTSTQSVDIDTEFAGFTNFVVSGVVAGAGAFTIDDAASGSTVTLMNVDSDATASDDVAVVLATDGTADVLNIVIGDGKTDLNVDGVTANDAETVNINVTAASATVATAAHAVGVAGAAGVNFTDATSIVLTGAGHIALADIEMKAADHTFDASDATGNLTLGFTTASQDQTIKTGSGKDDITMDDLDSDDVIDGGDGADTLTSGIEATLPTLLNVANVETVKLRIDDPAAAVTTDVRLATGMTDLHIIGTANSDENITINGLAAGTTVRLESLDETAGGDTHALNYAAGVTSAAIVMDEFGDSDAQSHSLTIDSQITSATISTDDAEANISTLTGAGLTSLTLAVGATDGNGIIIDSIAAAALTSLTITSSTDKNINIKAGTTDNDLATIDASGVDTGNNGEADVALGSGASIIDRSDTATITMGHGNDTVSFDVSQHGGNTIDADAGTDVLSMGGTQSGNIVIDLSSTTDQITTLNGVGNSAVQKGFESVDLSNVSVSSGAATITGSSTAGVLTGSSAADTITGGTAADTITGGAGADTITGGATGLDTFVIAAGDTVITLGGTGNAGTIAGMDTITDYAVGAAGSNAETLNVEGTAAVSTFTTTVDSTLTIGGNVIANHNLATGLITFDDRAGGYTAALTIDSLADVAAAIQYLQANDIGGAGDSVMFNVSDDTFGADSGTVAESVVFTQGSAAGTDNTLDTVVFLSNTGVVTDLLTTNASTAGAIFIA